MRGAIAGDVIGSRFEHFRFKDKEFPLISPQSRPTDDTVLTIAVAEALLGDGDYKAALRAWGRRYPRAGYGGGFRKWLQLDEEKAVPYRSYGNGSAMRVSAVAWLRHTPEEVLAEAERTALPTHDHPEGIKGAQAVALAVFRARQGAGKDSIRDELTARFGYDLTRRLDDIRPGYRFDVTCQGSVPEALIAFLESTDWEDAVRNAISLGGDTDTQACMAGAVAEAFYGGVPAEAWNEVESRLPPDMLELLGRFDTTVRAGPTRA